MARARASCLQVEAQGGEMPVEARSSHPERCRVVWLTKRTYRRSCQIRPISSSTLNKHFQDRQQNQKIHRGRCSRSRTLQPRMMRVNSFRRSPNHRQDQLHRRHPGGQERSYCQASLQRVFPQQQERVPSKQTWLLNLCAPHFENGPSICHLQLVREHRDLGRGFQDRAHRKPRR